MITIILGITVGVCWAGMALARARMRSYLKGFQYAPPVPTGGSVGGRVLRHGAVLATSIVVVALTLESRYWCSS